MTPQQINAALLVALWIVIVGVALILHLRALGRYRAKVALAREAEARGLVDTGTTTYALNQVLRYWFRVFESTWGIFLGALGTYALFYPQLSKSPLYGFIVLAFLYATQIITGGLTLRDLQVLDAMEKIDKARLEKATGEHPLRRYND